MANPIKYSTGSETLALKKGNFYIGTGAVGKGPTSETGYYNGITPPSGGYTIYLNKESNGPSIYTVSNDTELISLTNSIAGQSYTTVNQCFDYYYGQTDKVLVNQDYPADYPYIVMDGLILNLDAGITQSYPGSGTTWTDINGLGPKNNGTLTNGPTFNSDNGGSIVFDGVDDYVQLNNCLPLKWQNINQISLEVFFKFNSLSSPRQYIFDSRYDAPSPYNWYLLIVDPGGVLLTSTGANSSNSYTDIVVTTLNNNQIYMVNLTIDKTTTTNNFKVYVNGSLTSTNSFNWTTGQGSENNSIMYLGRAYPGGGYRLNGNIYNFKIYKNQVLTASEVLQNYNATKGRFGL
jgi:hypothetical protein